MFQIDFAVFLTCNRHPGPSSAFEKWYGHFTNAWGMSGGEYERGRVLSTQLSRYECSALLRGFGVLPRENFVFHDVCRSDSNAF